MFVSRPSIFSSSHHQPQPYESVVNPELPISHPNVYQWPSNQIVPMQQPSFMPFNVPENGVPWKCPEWMANQMQTGSYMNFNGQPLQQRLPFKRKAEEDFE